MPWPEILLSLAIALYLLVWLWVVFSKCPRANKCDDCFFRKSDDD